jgi:hypothetical protein
LTRIEIYFQKTKECLAIGAGKTLIAKLRLNFGGVALVFELVNHPREGRDSAVVMNPWLNRDKLGWGPRVGGVSVVVMNP